MTADHAPSDPARKPDADLARAHQETTLGRVAGLPDLPAGDFWITGGQLGALADVPPQNIATWRQRRTTARIPLPADTTLPGIKGYFFRASEAVEWLRARGHTPDWSRLSTTQIQPVDLE